MKNTKPKFLKANHIYIYASELSNLVGLNKFKKPAEVLLRIWKTNFPQEHKQRLDELQQQKKKITLEETKEETFQRIAKKYEDKTQKIQKEMAKCQKTKNVEKMIESQQKMIAHCQDLEEEDKIKIQKAIRDISQTSFGTRQENKSIHIYTQITNLPVLELKQFCKRPLIQKASDVWFIGGKIDGILEDNTIIEVKNRMRGLFKSVRDYEKIQTYAYMFILHSSQSQIVETYLNGTRQECGILEVDFEENYWQSIIQRILRFTNYFEKFRSSKKLQYQLLQHGIDKFELDIYDTSITI
jgi:hypothetical protein